MTKKIPFAKISKHTVASDNLDKVITETSSQTKRDYHSRFYGMYKQRLQKHPNITTYQLLNSLADEIEEKRNNGGIKYASLRQYKATINYALTYIAAALRDSDNKKIPPSQAPFYKELASKLSEDQIDALSARVLNWGSENAKNTNRLDKIANAKNQTSTSKMKAFPEAIYEFVMQDKCLGRHWLREFIYFNTQFGLRPREWQHAVPLTRNEFLRRFAQPADASVSEKALNIGRGVLDEETMQSAQDDNFKTMPYVLVVKNAKATHGRACGPHRFIHFDTTPEEFNRLNQLIEYLHKKSKESNAKVPHGVEYTFEKTIFITMQQQLYTLLKKYTPQRILADMHTKQLLAYQQYVKKRTNQGKKVDIGPPVFKKPTLYSTRHQAIANAKAEGFTPLQIAALFGHVSVHTASEHYAPKNRGHTGKSMLAPNPTNIEYILMSLDDFNLQAAQKQHDQSHTKDVEYTDDSTESYTKADVVDTTPATTVNKPSEPAKVDKPSADDKKQNTLEPSTSDGPGF